MILRYGAEVLMPTNITQALRKVRAASYDKGAFDELLKARPRECKDLIRVCEDPDQPERVRIAACRVLGEMKAGRSVSTLVKILATDSTNLAWAATLALESIATKTAVPSLIKIASSQPLSSARQNAIHALGCLGDARAAIVLRDILQDPNDSEAVRVEAAEAVKLLLYDGVRLRGVVPALIRALSDTSPLIRWSGAAALAHCADRRAVPALKKLLNDKATPGGLDSVCDQAESALIVLTSGRKG